MPNDTNDNLAKSPKDPVIGTVKRPPGPSERPGTEAEDAARGEVLPEPAEEPAGQRNTAFGGEPEGADHDTEEAAAYRENDA